MNIKIRWLKLLFLALYSILFLSLFNKYLISRSEVFYMSLPLIVGAFLFLFKKSYIIRAFQAKYIAKMVIYVSVVIVFFWFFSKMIGGRIIWKELFLSLCFLTSFGIITFSLARINLMLANYVSEKVTVVLKNSRFSFRIAKTVKITITVLLWLFIVFPYILATFSIHRPKIGNLYNPKSEFGLQYEDVVFKTSDHVLLRGWFVPNAKNDKSVIIGHGLGVNKSNFIELVSLWHQLGYNALIFDFRGHGDSQGHTLSLGFNEKNDIIAALDYLCTRKDIDCNKIIGYGVSFGAAALIQAAAQDKRIKILVVDSSFAEIDTMANKILDRLLVVPFFVRKPIIEMGLAMASLDLGFNIQRSSPLKSISRLKNQPILIIHAKKDNLIPCTESEKLYESASNPKQIYLVDSSGHYSTLVDTNYTTVLADFLQKHSSF